MNKEVLSKIVNNYAGEGSRIEIVTDPAKVRELLDSKSSVTYGQGEIPETEFFGLARCAPIKRGDHGFVYICSKELVATVKSEARFHCSPNYRSGFPQNAGMGDVSHHITGYPSPRFAGENDMVGEHRVVTIHTTGFDPLVVVVWAEGQSADDSVKAAFEFIRHCNPKWASSEKEWAQLEESAQVSRTLTRKSQRTAPPLPTSAPKPPKALRI